MARRILYIHGIGEIGGAERDLAAVLATLNRAEWEPHVACPAKGPFQALLRQAGVTVHSLVLPPWRKWLSLFARRSAVTRLCRLIVHLQPALIHVNDIWWVPHVVKALRRRSLGPIPVVAHVRQEIEPEKVPPYRLAQVQALIAISRHVQRALVDGGVNAQRVRTIYSGLPLPLQPESPGGRQVICRRLGLSSDDVLLGTVANLFPRKGYHVMLRALPAIIKRVPAAHYLIVGTGNKDYAQRLHILAGELGIAGHVHFVGFQDQVRPFLAALDLYVHPTLMEGFGIAVVEAMALGKAVVATDTGGLPEVVDHERTGLLVAPDSPEQLSQAVLSLLANAPKKFEMGALAAAGVRERFDLARSVAAIENVYRTMLVSKQMG